VATGLDDGRTDPRQIVEAFRQYLTHEAHRVTRGMFEGNLAGKLGDPRFNADMSVLLT